MRTGPAWSPCVALERVGGVERITVARERSTLPVSKMSTCCPVALSAPGNMRSARDHHTIAETMDTSRKIPTMIQIVVGSESMSNGRDEGVQMRPEPRRGGQGTSRPSTN